MDDEPQTSFRSMEDEMRARFEARLSEILERLPAPVDHLVVHDASARGGFLIDVIEATLDVDEGIARGRFVKLPRGYASVAFLREVFAVSGGSY